ncbi:MAG: DNA polymerase III subunit beta [Candidatus Omnitrophota bacterium]
MKFKTTKDVLLKGLDVIQNIISLKTTLPILSNVLIETCKDNLKLTATDLNIGIICAIPVNILEGGSITVPAKRFSGIIKELPEDEVEINTKKNNIININTKSCEFKILGLDSTEFPRLPEFKDKEVIKIEQGKLKEMLILTSFSVSMDETRYILNGLLFKISKNNLVMVATDGKRLAIIERKLPQDINKNIQIIIPQKTIQELMRNLKEDGDVSIIIGANQVMFDFGSIIIISRLIEGEFPDYQQVIPPVAETKLKVSREQFLLATKRAALLSTPDYQAVKLEVFKNKLVLSKSTPDIGESREELSIEYHGKELVVGFNPGYIIDVLKNLVDPVIEMELSGSEKPGVIRIDGYTYIVLPMRLS